MNKLIVCLTLLIGLIFTWANSSRAVVIYGTVKNSDLSTPANSDITFFSFIEGTDNEIRTEDSEGATYENGSYVDETSNFSGVDTGDQYDIYFTNVINGEAHRENTNIPALSAQRNVTLTANSNPAVPTGLSVSIPTQGTVRLTWDDVGGLTYHIYRSALMTKPGRTMVWHPRLMMIVTLTASPSITTSLSQRILTDV